MELNNLTRTNNRNSNGKQPSTTIDGIEIISPPNSVRRPRTFVSKCAPLACVVEALVIVSLVVYLSVHLPASEPAAATARPPETPRPTTSASSDSLAAPSSGGEPVSAFRSLTEGTNTTRIFTGLFPSCNQRVHDRVHGVRCSSRDTSLCARLEEPAKSTDRPLSTVVVTSKAGKRMQVELRSLLLPASETPGKLATKLRVLPMREQTILGWGGALTDSSISNILSLTTNGTRRLLDDYFGPDGLRFNMIRLTIGGSDFSARFYTNDDKANLSATDDLELRNFNLREEDSLYKIPMLKFIQSQYGGQHREPIKLFASMWSPPTWMKSNNHFNKGQLKGTPGKTASNSSSDRYFAALAELKRRFLLAYKDNGIDFWGLTVMNEPIFAAQPFLDFNTMIFPELDYASYISKHLGPTLRRDPKLAQLKLMAHDDNRRYLVNFTSVVLESDKVLQFVDGVSVHGYVDQDYQLMDEVYHNFRGRLNKLASWFVLPTELCSGHLPWMEKALIGNWHRGVHYALDIIRSLQHSAAGWVDWNMALDTRGGPGWLGGKLDSAVIVDKSEDAFYKSPMYFVLGHFSRYIPPGSVKLLSKIENANYDQHFETVSFLLPNKIEIATVVLNNNPYPVVLHIEALDTNYRLHCEADSITTLVYAPPKVSSSA